LAIAKVYDVITADGQKIGGFKLHSLQSMMQEHCDFLEVNGNPVGVIDQDTSTAMASKAVDMIGGALGGLFGGCSTAMAGMAAGNTIGRIISQTFVASTNNRPLCRHEEEMNTGMFFKMGIDINGDKTGLFDRTLGIAGAVPLPSKHLTQGN
jgi:hypothetical protein